jgi:hypothetical protein
MPEEKYLMSFIAATLLRFKISATAFYPCPDLKALNLK